ncbi:hypothetical protein [Celeribacter litoreus]|uniref:hypothetical protein n=1 Tax=Celeribacter litoreus TaxID=2876714 RepID=UPI001CCE9EFB|nr:hypothetical protein [Celeribacter litoreus]MCA0043829.1 hypothetical protein [Celeribacter litoreus]
MFLRTSAISIAFLATAGVAFADGLSYSSVEVTHMDIEGTTVDNITGSFDYLTGALSFTGTADVSDFGGTDVHNLSFSAGYEFMPNMTIYAALGTSDDGRDSGSDYGIGAEYKTATYGAAIDYHDYDAFDYEVLTVAGYYEFGNSVVFGSYRDIEGTSIYNVGYTFDAPTWDVDLESTWYDEFDAGLTSIATSYALTDAIRLQTSMTTLNDDFFNVGVATLGGEYRFNDALSLEADYSESYGDNRQAQIFTLAFKWENGADRARVLDKVADFSSNSDPYYDLFTELSAGGVRLGGGGAR